MISEIVEILLVCCCSALLCSVAILYMHSIRCFFPLCLSEALCFCGIHGKSLWRSGEIRDCIYKCQLPKNYCNKIAQSSYLSLSLSVSFLVCIGISPLRKKQMNKITSFPMEWHSDAYPSFQLLPFSVYRSGFGVCVCVGAHERVNIVKSSNRKTQYQEQEHEDRFSTANGKTNRTNGEANARDFDKREHHSFRILHIQQRTTDSRETFPF